MDTCPAISSKTIMPISRNFDVYLHAKSELHPLFLFWGIVKILQTCYFEYFENAWSCPSIMIVSPCRKLWCPKCWNQLVGNFDVYLHTKKLISLFTFSLRYCKLVILVLWASLATHKQSVLSTCRNFFCLSAGKKSPSSPVLMRKIWRKDMKKTSPFGYFGYYTHL